MESGSKVCVVNEVALQEIGDNKTRAVVLQCKVVEGKDEGQFVKWQGWLNSEANLARTIKSLRIAGWVGRSSRGLAAGKLEGMGTKRFLLGVEIEVNKNRDGKVRRYPRGTFINPIPTLDASASLSDRDFDALDRELGKVEPEPDEDGVFPDDPGPSDSDAPPSAARGPVQRFA